MSLLDFVLQESLTFFYIIRGGKVFLYPRSPLFPEEKVVKIFIGKIYCFWVMPAFIGIIWIFPGKQMIITQSQEDFSVLRYV